MKAKMVNSCIMAILAFTLSFKNKKIKDQRSEDLSWPYQSPTVVTDIVDGENAYGKLVMAVSMLHTAVTVPAVGNWQFWHFVFHF
ncbi:hypothetical protein A2U01_0019847 [Trifolium medium]|uniref:Uncharacterized protein n=1 Tax=Trifolium medium TaxID=97028 RepID=A0A392NIA9_9FABA|nr:hypothetical protein [Trifolium medium]